MYCPYCGTKNADDATVCINSSCQKVLPQRSPKPRPQAPVETWTKQPEKVDPFATTLTIGALSGLIGGVMVVIGWFLPWLEIDIFGYTIISGGNGPQIIINLLGAGLLGGGFIHLAADQGIGLLIICLSLFLVTIIVLVPIFGFSTALNGWRLYAIKINGSKTSTTPAIDYVNQIRSRLLVVVVMVALIFVSASFISLAALGRGFWLTAIGALGGFIGALYTQAQLNSGAIPE